MYLPTYVGMQVLYLLFQFCTLCAPKVERLDGSSVSRFALLRRCGDTSFDGEMETLGGLFTVARLPSNLIGLIAVIDKAALNDNFKIMFLYIFVW